MKKLTNLTYEKVGYEMLSELKDFIEEVVDMKLQNEQWFLDFLDELNELSTSW
jgi:hypothetical protein